VKDNILLKSQTISYNEPTIGNYNIKITKCHYYRGIEVMCHELNYKLQGSQICTQNTVMCFYLNKNTG